MNHLKLKTIKLINGLLLFFICGSIVSCDHLIKNKVKDDRKDYKEALNANKDEAKLLLMLSKDNQDVIKLSKLLQTVEIEDEDYIVGLAKKLEQTHKEIAEEYNDIASESLISIPDYSDLKTPSSQLIDDSEAKIRILNQITLKINNQLYLLKKLSDSTNNVEFKVLAVRAKPKLKDNLNKASILLNNIENNS